MGSYYVYELRRPNGKPFYVGKGTKSRISFHEWNAKNGGKGYLCNVIRKIVASGGKIIKVKVKDGLSDAEAKSFERELIAMYGRVDRGGILVNMTDGGDGCEGFTHDLVSKMKLSEAWDKRRGKPMSEETRKKLSAASKGRKHSEESKKKISNAISGQKHWNFGKKISDSHKSSLHAVLKKPVLVDGVRYESVGVAAKVHGIASSTAVYRILHGKNRDNYGEWKYAK